MRKLVAFLFTFVAVLSISVGAVTHGVNAAATKVGNGAQAVLNFVLLQGPAGLNCDVNSPPGSCDLRTVTTTNLNRTVTVQPGTGTISAALAANSGGSVEFKLGCGTYTDNVSFTSSFNWIHGGGRGCTVLQPGSSSAPLVNIHPASAGAGLWYNSISDLTMTNPRGYAVDGLQLNNLVSPSPHNDANHFWNLYIAGFKNNISILGGNLSNTFDDVEVWNAIANNVNVNTTQPVNSLTFHMLQDFSAGGYGVYANTPSAIDWDFQSPDIEENGSKILTSNCAGMYFNSGKGYMQSINIYGSGYFEANCTGGDAHAADIRLTGNSVVGVTIQGSRFSYAAGGNYGCAVFADAIAGSAFIANNLALKPASTCGTDYKITNNDSTGSSIYVVGPNHYLNNGQGEYAFSGTGAMTYVTPLAGGAMSYPLGVRVGVPSSPAGFGLGVYGSFLQSHNAGTATGTGGAITATIRNNSVANAGAAGENMLNFQWSDGSLAARFGLYSTGSASKSSGWKWYCENGHDTPYLCATLDPTGNLRIANQLAATGVNSSGPVTGSTIQGVPAVAGVATLSSGTVTVLRSEACSPSSSCIYKLTNCGKNSSTAIGTLSLGTVSSGTSFVIHSLTSVGTVATGDSSTVCWQIN